MAHGAAFTRRGEGERKGLGGSRSGAQELKKKAAACRNVGDVCEPNRERRGRGRSEVQSESCTVCVCVAFLFAFTFPFLSTKCVRSLTESGTAEGRRETAMGSGAERQDSERRKGVVGDEGTVRLHGNGTRPHGARARLRTHAHELRRRQCD